MDIKSKIDVARSILDEMNHPYGLNPLIVPTYIVPLEELTREGYIVMQPNACLPELNFKFDLVVDVSTQKKHPGYESIPLIDYTTFVKGSTLNLNLALKNFEKSRFDTFDRAMFFSSNPGDIKYYGKVSDNQVFTVPWYVVDELALSKSNPVLSSILCAEIGDVYEKYCSKKI